VALTWLACNYLDVLLAQHKGRGLSPAQENHLDQLRDRAQRQHLLAVKTLATVRTLLPSRGRGRVPDEAGTGFTDTTEKRRGRRERGRRDRRRGDVPDALLDRLRSAVSDN
jgi:hypothetical protein